MEGNKAMERKKVGYVDGGVLLPVHTISTMEGYDGEAALRDAGVVFHEPLEDCRALRLAELPAGWKITENYGITLLDNKNRVRATMVHFEGWSFVSARMTVACPFIISFRGERERKLVGRVRMRYGGEIMAMPPTTIKRVRKPNRKWGARRYGYQKTGQMKAEKIARLRQWLEEALPGWQTSSKYWDYQKVA
jgi:hypothetical protein